MPGFVAIDFARGDVPNQQKVLLDSDNDSITQENLAESLGKDADRYVVKSVERL